MNSQVKFKETKPLALKGFTTQYLIEPRYKIFDPNSLLIVVKQKALEKFKPQTKVRMVLRAKMENIILTAIDKTSVEVQNFQSKLKLFLNQQIWMNYGMKYVNRFLKTWQLFK